MNPNLSENQYAPCPNCGQTAAERVSFTLWGGASGPKMLTHVKCGACGKTYNGKTGTDNFVSIIIYTIVSGIIVFAVFFAVFFYLR